MIMSATEWRDPSEEMPLQQRDLRLLDQLARHRHFLRNTRRQSGRTVGADVEADAEQLCRHVGLPQHRERVGCHAVDDFPGHAGRRIHALEGLGDHAGEAGLLHGRHVGQVGPSLLAGYRQRPQGAGLDVRMGGLG